MATVATASSRAKATLRNASGASGWASADRDAELVRRAKRGDGRAYGSLVARYQDKIYRLARRMTVTDEDAEDVLQEAFVKAYKSLGTFEGKSRFSTWLYRITVNLALMKLRKRRIDTVSMDVPVSTEQGSAPREFENGRPDPLEALLAKESRDVLDKAIAGLPTGYRAVFVLRHVEELSTEETARILKISVAAVKSRLHRTRILLREQLLRQIKHQRKTGRT
jgi:RNA polymerase sigma-70 factor (ECF subfamily)